MPFHLALARRPSQDFVYRQGHRREAVPGGDVGLAVDFPLQSRHLPVGFGGVDDLGAHLLDDAGQALGEAFVEDWVLLKTLVDLGADGVFHHRGPRLGVGAGGLPSLRSPRRE